MIAIVNISQGPAFGWQEYELRINDHIITRFKHRREDGLTVCLLKAAAAAEREACEAWRVESELFKKLSSIAPD